MDDLSDHFAALDRAAAFIRMTGAAALVAQDFRTSRQALDLSESLAVTRQALTELLDKINYAKITPNSSQHVDS